MADVACLSKYHFLRLFKATYGVTPMEYVSRRRIERAQDLLRSTNLTVTEVCFAVGFSSLGSFSKRFRELVGESADGVPAALCGWRAAHPRVLHLHVGPGRATDQPEVPQSRRSRRRPTVVGSRMITNISIVSVFVKDVDESKRFYTEVLGFDAKDDITLGDGYRWCTVVHPSQPELMVSLAVPGPPHPPELVEAMKRAQDEGGMHGLGLNVDDCQKTYEELSAKGRRIHPAAVGAAVRHRGVVSRQLGQLAGADRAVEPAGHAPTTSRCDRRRGGVQFVAVAVSHRSMAFRVTSRTSSRPCASSPCAGCPLCGCRCPPTGVR